jgi:hypothetical protein
MLIGVGGMKVKGLSRQEGNKGKQSGKSRVKATKQDQ